MKRGRLQAKDVSDERMLELLAAVRGRHGVPRWSSWFDVEAILGDIPSKVARAKLASMIRRGVIRGCACGCRGDFELAPPPAPDADRDAVAIMIPVVVTAIDHERGTITLGVAPAPPAGVG